MFKQPAAQGGAVAQGPAAGLNRAGIGQRRCHLDDGAGIAPVRRAFKQHTRQVGALFHLHGGCKRAVRDKPKRSSAFAGRKRPGTIAAGQDGQRVLEAEPVFVQPTVRDRRRPQLQSAFQIGQVHAAAPVGYGDQNFLRFGWVAHQMNADDGFFTGRGGSNVIVRNLVEAVGKVEILPGQSEESVAAQFDGHRMDRYA